MLPSSVKDLKTCFESNHGVLASAYACSVTATCASSLLNSLSCAKSSCMSKKQCTLAVLYQFVKLMWILSSVRSQTATCYICGGKATPSGYTRAVLLGQASLRAAQLQHQCQTVRANQPTSVLAPASCGSLHRCPAMRLSKSLQPAPPGLCSCNSSLWFPAPPPIDQQIFILACLHLPFVLFFLLLCICTLLACLQLHANFASHVTCLQVCIVPAH